MFDELYQEIILDHASHPRHQGAVPDPDSRVEADNPLCGDEITLTVKAGEGRTIQEVRFVGNACAICTASTSMMTVQCRGQSFETIRELSRNFQSMVRDEPHDESRLSGELKVLAGVKKFPMRVKCATLPWHAIDAAIRQIESGASADPVRVDATERQAENKSGVVRTS